MWVLFFGTLIVLIGRADSQMKPGGGPPGRPPGPKPPPAFLPGAKINVTTTTTTTTLSPVLFELLEPIQLNRSWLMHPPYPTKHPKPHVLDPLFYAGQDILKAFTEEDAYPKGIVSAKGLHFDEMIKKWPKLLSYYAAVVAMLVLFAFSVSILPLCGLMWCCHWWCRGSRHYVHGGRVRRGLVLALFLLLLLVYLAALVCLFESESQLECAIGEAIQVLEEGYDDVLLYFKYLLLFVRWLLQTTFLDIRKIIGEIMHGMGDMIAGKLTNATQASAINSMFAIMDRLDFMKNTYNVLHTRTKALRSNAEQFNTGLQAIKQEVLAALATCDQPECSTLRASDKMRLLDTQIYFDEIKDVSRRLQKVEEVLAGQLRDEVAGGVQVLRDIQHRVRRASSLYKPIVDSVVGFIGDRMADLQNNITAVADNVTDMLHVFRGQFDRMRATAAHYGPYRQHLVLAAPMCLLLIFVLLSWGFVCCLFGSDPVSCRRDECFDQATGARILIWSIRAMFVLTMIVALSLAIYFTITVVIQRFICDPIANASNSRLIRDVEKMLKTTMSMRQFGVPIDTSVSSALDRCHKNMSLVQVLNLTRYLSVDQLMGSIVITRRRMDRLPLLPSVLPAHVQLLSEPARRMLHECLEEDLLDFHFDLRGIRTAANIRISTRELDSLALELNRTAKRLKQPKFAETTRRLWRASDALGDMAHNVLRQLRSSTDDDGGFSFDVEEMMQIYGLSDVAQFYKVWDDPSVLGPDSELAETIIKIKEAEKALKMQGELILQKFINASLGGVRHRLVTYVETVVYILQHDVARCGPLSNIYNATVSVLCQGILLPMNGYWLSLLICLVLLFPLALTAKYLARLYMFVYPCPGPHLYKPANNIK